MMTWEDELLKDIDKYLDDVAQAYVENIIKEIDATSSLCSSESKIVFAAGDFAQTFYNSLFWSRLPGGKASRVSAQDVIWDLGCRAADKTAEMLKQQGYAVCRSSANAYEVQRYIDYLETP